MTNEEILKEQIKSLEKLIEIKDQTIGELLSRQFIQYKVIPYYPFQQTYPYNPFWYTSTSGTIDGSSLVGGNDTTTISTNIDNKANCVVPLAGWNR